MGIIFYWFLGYTKMDEDPIGCRFNIVDIVRIVNFLRILLKGAGLILEPYSVSAFQNTYSQAKSPFLVKYFFKNFLWCYGVKT